MAIGIMVTDFWHVTQLILVDTYQYFRDTFVYTFTLFSTLKTDVPGSSETVNSISLK